VIAQAFVGRLAEVALRSGPNTSFRTCSSRQAKDTDATAKTKGSAQDRTPALLPRYSLPDPCRLSELATITLPDTLKPPRTVLTNILLKPVVTDNRRTFHPIRSSNSGEIGSDSEVSPVTCYLFRASWC
jgi:hypothetical protein